MLLHQFYKVSVILVSDRKASSPAQLILLYFSGALVVSLLESKRYRIGGAKRDRTADPLRARQVLSQLSYSPSVSFLSPLGHITFALRQGGGPGWTRTTDLTLIRGAL